MNLLQINQFLSVALLLVSKVFVILCQLIVFIQKGFCLTLLESLLKFMKTRKILFLAQLFLYSTISQFHFILHFFISYWTNYFNWLFFRVFLMNLNFLFIFKMVSFKPSLVRFSSEKKLIFLFVWILPKSIIRFFILNLVQVNFSLPIDLDSIIYQVHPILFKWIFDHFEVFSFKSKILSVFKGFSHSIIWQNPKNFQVAKLIF